MSKNNRGQSLIEVLIAITIASLVAIGLVRATGTSVKNSTYSKDQGLATDLAQKKINSEIELKNLDPTLFFNRSSAAVVDETNPGFCLLTSLPVVTIFPTPANSNAKMRTISVTVFWEETTGGNDCGTKTYKYKTSLETNVTN